MNVQPRSGSVPENDGAAAADERPKARAVERVFRLLEILVATDDGITLTALSHQADVPLASCGVMMETLEDLGYATRVVVGRRHLWRATLAIYRLAAQVISRLDVPTVARRHLEQLAESVQMPAHLGVLDGDKLVYVAKVTAPGFFQFDTYVGKASAFNLTALGRAIAAYLPGPELEKRMVELAVGNGPLAKPGDPATLQADLETVRSTGYSVENEEEIAGVACVAAPVFDARGDAVASIGTTWFSRELTDDRLADLITDVRAAAQRTSADLGHQAATNTTK